MDRIISSNPGPPQSTFNKIQTPNQLKIENTPPNLHYQLVPPNDHQTPLTNHENGMNCFAAMTCLACTIPITLAALGGAMFFLSFRYTAEKDLLLNTAYICIGLFCASCIIFTAYFCLREKQPGDQNAVINGLFCASTCSEAANALASCGILCEICSH